MGLEMGLRKIDKGGIFENCHIDGNNLQTFHYSENMFYTHLLVFRGFSEASEAGL